MIVRAIIEFDAEVQSFLAKGAIEDHELMEFMI